MPVNFKDFYDFATSGNFSRGSAIVLSGGGQSKFQVSTSDHSWAIVRSGDDKKLNNDIRDAFYKAVSGQCKGNIPESVLSALNLGDFKLDTDGNASSGRPLTAYRMKQVFKAMKKEGIEMPNINLIEEPIVDEDNDHETLALNKSAIPPNEDSSRIIINLDENMEGPIKINDIALEKSPELVVQKDSVENSEQVQPQEVKKKPSFTREERLLRSYLGHRNIQDILKGIPEAKRGEAKAKIEAALQANGQEEEALIGVVRYLNTIKFRAMLDNGDEEVWDDVEVHLYSEFQNKPKECEQIDNLAYRVAKDFEKEWLEKDNKNANKPLTPKGLELAFILFLEKRGPQYEEAFQLDGKVKWNFEMEWEQF